jgi:hypothetical protein
VRHLSACYPAAVLRALLILATLTSAFELSGLAAAAGEIPCSEECSSEDAGLPCAPNCQLCCCCSLPRTIGSPAAPVASPPRDVRRVTWSAGTIACPSPDPRDITHVPKLRDA